jgi:energy-coupling factor transport system permease protein
VTAGLRGAILARPVGRPTRLARRNPVAKFAAGLLLTAFLVATLDPLAPAIALVLELALVPLFGVRYRDLARRAAPILFAVLGILVSLVIFGGDRSGAVLLRLGPVVVTTGLLVTALALSLRLLAIALPGLVILSTTDATDLADALVQNLRVPARFAIGALAAFRLLPLLADEWRTIGLARRARGVEAGRNPVARVRLFASTAFALLVAAIRRGTRLATAMDARGFDAGVPRTTARRQRFGPADAALVLGGALAGAIPVVVSVYLGTFDPLLA